MNRLGRQLNHRTGFDISPRADVMGETSGCRAERLPLIVIISIDHDDGFCGACVDHKLSGPLLLLWRERQIGTGVGANGTINVKPGVHHTQFDQAVDPGVIQEVIEIRLAKTGANTG